MKIHEIPDFFVQFFRQILSELFFGARVFHDNQVSLYFVDNISCSSDPTTNSQFCMYEFSPVFQAIRRKNQHQHHCPTNQIFFILIPLLLSCSPHGFTNVQSEFSRNFFNPTETIFIHHFFSIFHQTILGLV
jgi:hypothetical protein